MNNDISNVARAVKLYLGDDEKKIQHFVRVYTIAKSIGEFEHLPQELQNTLELSALVHDIDSQSSADGDENSRDNQLFSGATNARKLLVQQGIDEETVQRVCYIVENHHDYDHISGLDHQILVEADLIVYFKEACVSREQIAAASQRYFITNYGRAMLKKAFGI